MSREYDQLAWVDYPETLTPISAANLNRMENGIANLYTDRNKMENNIAYVEEGEEATRHYFINSYLMLNGIFYKTTSEINIGDILDPTLAGNIEHVDVSSQFGSGGGGSTGCVELTQAQYDALSEEAKMLDVIYLITDSPDNYLDEVFGDFASVEYTDTASKAYAVGEYLVYDSKFYKVTSAIEQGDTIVPDTNVVKTTVADEFSNASNVDYSNTTSGLTATDVQGALDELASPTAEGVSYDNSQSGLTATNVQSALNETNSKIGYKFNIYSAFPRTTTDANRLKITVPSEPYLYLSGIILSRYGVYTFNMSEDANRNLSCTASKLSGSSGESVTTSVSNFTALFTFTSTWNNFGVIFMTPSYSPSITFNVDKV